MDIAAKKELTDRIQWNKSSGAAWWKDGFFYSGYDKPAAGKELTAKNEFQKVFYHKLGDPQEKDTLVYEDKDHPLRYFSTSTSEDEKFVFLTVSEGTSGTELYWKEAAKKTAACPTCGAQVLQNGKDTQGVPCPACASKEAPNPNQSGKPLAQPSGAVPPPQAKPQSNVPQTGPVKHYGSKKLSLASLSLAGEE
jgi:DNA-directed RNA polymerase subunit RPC12/RpoP